MLLRGISRQKGETARSVALALRQDILRGRFGAGETLPGSRTLARQWSVSRGTVNVALAMLAAEGLVKTTPAGVCILFEAQQKLKAHPARRVRFSAWAGRLPELPAKSGAAAFFATGRIAAKEFPEQPWLRSVRAARRELLSARNLYSHTDAAGAPGLREAIAAHLRTTRAIDAEARHIVITTGSMQAIALLTQLLLEKGDRAAFENPGYRGIREAIRAAGATALACPVDQGGMQIPQKPCRLAFVTPASQFPLGMTMSAARRAELLGWSLAQQAIIVEDEYDSEFYRFLNPPPALATSSEYGQVIYLGSFSRTLFSGLRLGYALLPPGFTDIFLRARRLYDPISPATGDQLALEHFMRSGEYRRHLRRMNRIYRERHDTLISLMRDELDEFFEPLPSAAGLSVCARWKKSAVQFRHARASALAADCAWQDCAPYFAGKPGLLAVFGFAHLEPEKIASGIRRLAQSLRGKRA